MAHSLIGPELDRLIKLLAKLPGLGPRSARRAALQLIKKRDTLMSPLAAALQEVVERVVVCATCGNIDTQDPCSLCQAPGRDGHLICVVEEVGDLWALERGGSFRGRYHVLGGTLSALDGIGPDDLNVAGLVSRAQSDEVMEIILAMNATVDGQSTAHYLMDLLTPCGVTVTRLAHGVPVGGELDYLDDGTLAAALQSRRPLI